MFYRIKNSDTGLNSRSLADLAINVLLEVGEDRFTPPITTEKIVAYINESGFLIQSSLTPFKQ